MNLDDLSRDQLCALVRLYQATAEVRATLNQALLDKTVRSGAAELNQALADVAAWSGFHDELTMRASTEIQSILSGDVEAPDSLN